MTAKRKVIFVVTTLVVLLFSFTVSVFAYSPPNSVFTNPYCPTVYGNYMSNNIAYSREVGGYANTSRFMVNNRNTYYMTCRYLPWLPTAYHSIFNDGYLISSVDYHSNELPYFATDSIVYGLSTQRGGANGSGSSDILDSYIYFPTYYARDVGLNFYFSGGPSSNLSSIDTIFYDGMVDFESLFVIAISYFDDSSEFHSIELAYDLTDSENCPFYADNAFYKISRLLEDNGVAWNDDFRIYSIGATCSFVNAFTLDSGYLTYANYLFAIPDAEDYISENEYVSGFTQLNYQKGFNHGYDVGYVDGNAVGYHNGFADGGDIKNFGVFGFIGKSIGGVMAIEIFDGFAIGHIVLVAIVVPLFLWILKVFGGG